MNWDDIDLVIFDVDGTLYDQRRLRARMLAALLRGVVESRQLLVPQVIGSFRRHREKLGSDLDANFVTLQYSLTAQACGCPEKVVRQIVKEWIERRPLAHVGRCIYPGVRSLFDALAASGRKVAVFSDYPAEAKLAALGLQCPLTVSAEDGDVLRLKPHPAGLDKILRLTGVEAGRAILIGDRFDRDWQAANSIGMKALIRARRATPSALTFRSYADTLFEPLLGTTIPA